MLYNRDIQKLKKNYHNSNNIEIQIDNIISILSTLLTGGVLIILIETLHLSNVISDRFYAKMKPFENSFVSYINFVKLMESNIVYKKKEEYVKSFKLCFLISNKYQVRLKKQVWLVRLTNFSCNPDKIFTPNCCMPITPTSGYKKQEGAYGKKPLSKGAGRGYALI